MWQCMFRFDTRKSRVFYSAVCSSWRPPARGFEKQLKNHLRKDRLVHRRPCFCLATASWARSKHIIVLIETSRKIGLCRLKNQWLSWLMLIPKVGTAISHSLLRVRSGPFTKLLRSSFQPKDRSGSTLEEKEARGSWPCWPTVTLGWNRSPRPSRRLPPVAAALLSDASALLPDCRRQEGAQPPRLGRCWGIHNLAFHMPSYRAV